jgi:hypothetical protein
MADLPRIKRGSSVSTHECSLLTSLVNCRYLTSADLSSKREKGGVKSQGFFQSVINFNSFIMAFNRSSRLSRSAVAVGCGLGIRKYARFNSWISAISRLSASTRSRMPPSMRRDYTRARLLLAEGPIRSSRMLTPFFCEEDWPSYQTGREASVAQISCSTVKNMSYVDPSGLGAPTVQYGPVPDATTE